MPSFVQSPIYILGLGNIGKLVAHALASSHPAPPQVTLLLHRPGLATQWDEAGRHIDVVTKGVSDSRGGFQIEETLGDESGFIKHLIVATKTYTTVPALKPLRHRLSDKSTMLFLQNGMGTIEEVTDGLFANPSARPHFLAGVVSHGVYKNRPFSVTHAGMGDITLGEVHPSHGPKDSSVESETPMGQSKYLLSCLSAAPVLSASVVLPADLLQKQLEKLAINAIINPLTVIFDCLNGELFNRPPIRALIRALMAEILCVLRSIMDSSSTTLVEKQEAEARFSLEGLIKIVENAAVKTAQNISSMRQDVRAGRLTEINYINGYIVKRGTEQGIDCTLNRALVQMVQDKQIISESQIQAFMPHNIAESCKTIF
ncbi:2-dehydropantoate 2-reductase (Ketopantoate reductase) (KPA reductase) (KPR) [Pseudocyphellaria aurata]|nr:2-dehydropantoate 2-reductase (Ketopantoate reductase) (KPA reductase) (KPR) [Pseudocyphellaria aurata]